MYRLRNHRTMNLKLSRHDVCDLLLALTAVKESSNANHWSELHDKIKIMLADFDEELDKEEEEREQENELRRLKNKMSKI